MWSISQRGTGLAGASASKVAVLTVGIALLAGPCRLLAQRGGGGGGGGRTERKPLVCIYDCSTTSGTSGEVSSEDDLKNFQRLLAVEATPDQSAALTKVMQYAQTASAQLQAFRDLLQKAPTSAALSDRAASLHRALNEARAGNQNFLDAFSPVQQAGLKDVSKRLLKADSDLDIQIKAWDRTWQTPRANREPIAASAASLAKAVESFQSAQFALASEMGIIAPSAGQDLTLKLPAVTTSIQIAGQSIAIPGSGVVSRTPAAGGPNLFGLRFSADLTDLQQNITDVLRSQLDRSPGCGERIEIQGGTLIPHPPAVLVMAHLHYERWICPSVQTREGPLELAASDGAIEIKLTPAVEANADLHLVSEISRVDADGALRELLLSGSLGDTFREQLTASLLSILERGANFKTAIPPAAQELTTIRTAQFQDAGAGRLILILNGQLHLSDQQAKQFADQLKELLAAQKTSPP
jgi:hypothetical protein